MSQNGESFGINWSLGFHLGGSVTKDSYNR